LNSVFRFIDTRFRVIDFLERVGLISEDTFPVPIEKINTNTTTNNNNDSNGTPPSRRSSSYQSRIPLYTPDFRLACKHICIHAGGRAVIDAIQSGLKLNDSDVEPSRAVLKRYGNTSSSSIWYEFRYCELNRNIKRGEKVWQLGFGSGFKVRLKRNEKKQIFFKEYRIIFSLLLKYL
jgi:hypothetical protein